MRATHVASDIAEAETMIRGVQERDPLVASAKDLLKKGVTGTPQPPEFVPHA
jgi:hypothetical protein